MDAAADVGGVGVSTRGDRLENLIAIFEQEGCSLLKWYGIRVFTDHLGNEPANGNLDDILAAELLAAAAIPTGKWPACCTSSQP
jgi:S-adenosylmethionine-dependent methyltransferase